MKEFDVRRAKLLDKMENNSVALIFSGVSKISSEDEFLPFVVNRNFFYLSGIEQENSCLMLIKGVGVTKENLFIDPFDPVKERWTGKKLNVDQAKDLSQVSNVFTNDAFASMLTLVFEGKYGEIKNLYVDLAPEIKIKNEYSTKSLAEDFKAKYNLNIIDVYPMIRDMRMVKSELEIEELRAAIRKTNIGINRLIKALKPGMYEYELADLFEFSGREKGRSNLAFSTIVGAGVNSTCLHYPTQDCKIQADDIILFDLGYRENLYCADISRTYPVSGVYSPMQRKVYEAVLNCNKAVIAYIREGLTIKDLQEFATNYLKNECVRLKLISPEEDIRKYYIHNISHHLGLDTHDISDRSRPLEKGNVITVEPGLYFPELKIGVRIEDDVLVTSGRAEVLSDSIIKEANDIEKLFKTKK